MEDLPCVDCGKLVTIKSYKTGPLPIPPLCDSCLSIRVEKVKAERYKKVDRRGRPKGSKDTKPRKKYKRRW